MKIIWSILVLTYQLSLAQTNYFAVITDLQIGAKNNADNLIEAVNDINLRQNVSYVIVLGNITANGKFDEFIWAQEILDGLIVPYFVIGGEKDYLLSEGKGSEISLIWNDENIFFETENFSLLGINTLQPEYPGGKYIDVETLNRVDKFSSSSLSNKVIIFSYSPINVAANSNKIFESLLDQKLFSFVSKKIGADESISTFEGLYLNRSDTWGYLLVSIKKDSIQIKKILGNEIKNKTKPEIAKLKFSVPKILESITPKKFLPEENLLWLVNFKKTISKGSVYYSEKIITVFKDGTISCLDKNGIEKWQFESNKRIIDQPLIKDDILVIATEDGDIFTINVNTGNIIQSIALGEKITSSLAIAEITDGGSVSKTIVAGTQYGNLYCYDLFTLDPVWSQQFSGMDDDLQIVSTVVYSDNKIFFRDSRGKLYCIGAKNGMLIWNISSAQGGWKGFTGKSGFNHKVNLIIRNNNLYLIDGSGNFFSVDALLGSVKWNIKNIDVKDFMVEKSQTELLLPTTNNKILVISTKLGKVVNEIELPSFENDVTITDIILISNNIIVSFSNGWVYSMKPKQKFEKLFRNGIAPIVSINDVEGNCLITDFDGDVTLLTLQGK